MIEMTENKLSGLRGDISYLTSLLGGTHRHPFRGITSLKTIKEHSPYLENQERPLLWGLSLKDSTSEQEFKNLYQQIFNREFLSELPKTSHRSTRRSGIGE